MIPVPIYGVGSVGVISDQPGSTLPPAAWSAATNVHFRGAIAEGKKGANAAFGTPQVTPYQLMFFPTAGGNFWVYCGSSAVRAFQGRTDADITRTSGGYNKPTHKPWTGGFLGGIPLINNPGDVPQFWAPAGITQELQDLTNWPTDWRAEFVRVWGQFIIAGGVDEGGGPLPFSLRWSTAAAPGTLPTTWDETNLSEKAGVRELADSAGVLVDSFPLRSFNLIYKEDKVYVMQFIGGSEVFSVTPLFQDFGALGPWCVADIGSESHIVLTSYVAQRGGDVLVHNGNSSQSIITPKRRKWLSRAINRDNMKNSFLVVSREKNEVYICIPTGSSVYPDKALIWHQDYNTLSEIDIPLFSHGMYGEEDTDTAATYGDLHGTTYGSLHGSTYGSFGGDSGFGRLLFSQPSTPLLAHPEAAYTELGEPVSTLLERRGVSLPDTLTGQYVQLAYIHFDIEYEGTVSPQVFVGTQEGYTDPVTWWGPFNIDTESNKVHTVGGVPTTRRLSLRILATSSTGRFILKGYTLYVVQRGL